MIGARALAIVSLVGAVALGCGACSSGSSSSGAGPSGSSNADAGSIGDGGSAANDGAAAGADGGATRPVAGIYVLHETFDAMTTAAAPPAPWSVQATNGGSALVQEVPFAADKSVTVTKLAGAGTTSLAYDVGAQHGRVVFEAKVLARETAGFKAIPYVYDASGNAVASVSFQDGNVQAHVGATITTVQPFVANEWYRVRVVIDTDHGTFDLFVDGVRKLAAQTLRMASPSVQKFSYYVDGANAGTLLVDDVKVYTEAAYIGAAPAPVFDPRDYGATGNGTTKDTAAIQKAVDAAAGTGGSVVLKNGTFLSGSVTLKSDMTFFLDASATLLGSTDVADYPTETPDTGNTQLGNCQRALLYAADANNLVIDGGGTLDGQGDSFSGVEATRPMLIWAVKSQNVAVQNLYLKKGAVWSLVSMESDHVLIRNVNVQSDGITHDGIDVVDGTDITVDDCAVRSGDDAMCLKTGVRRGIDGMVVKNSLFGGSGTSGGSNGIKFGTGTYGAFKNVVVQDDYVKEVQYAAMAVESRQGADVDGVSFQRIQFMNAGSAFFVYLAQQNVTAPTGDVPKLGSMKNVSFTDVSGTTTSWGNSPHQGSLVTGHLYDSVAYPIQNLAFTRVNVTFDGGLGTVPAAPPEATPNQYPESNMFGDLPAWGYYLRHVNGVTFDACTSNVAAADARQKMVTSDVTGVVGAP